MAVYHAESLLFGPFAERPALSDPTIYSASGISLFLATDTGGLYETSGSAWTLLGTLISPGLPDGVASDADLGLTVVGVVRGGSFLQVGMRTQPQWNAITTEVAGSGPAAGTYKYFIAIGNDLGVSPYETGFGVITVDGGHAVQVDFDPREVIGSDVTRISLYRGLRNAAGGPWYLADSVGYPTLNHLTDTMDDTAIINQPQFPAYDQSLPHCIIGPLDVQGAIGEFGKTAPSVQPTITGNVTTGILADLQAVMGQLLTALDAKGEIVKSTT